MTGGGEQHLFLGAHILTFPLTASLLRVMVVCAANSSCIERGYKYLKTIKSDTRNRMGHDQLERLWLLSAHLPDLQSFDVSKVVAALK